jgi:hypothetical protein
MPNPFICPCGETRAQQLLTSHLCANPSCSSYDENFAREGEISSEIDEELITPVTFSDSTGSNTDIYTLTYSSAADTQWTVYKWEGSGELMLDPGVAAYDPDKKVDELEERVSSLEETVEILQKAVLQLQQNAISPPKSEPKPRPSESYLQMEMAIDAMRNSHEATHDTTHAEMQLEKIRHATQMQMENLKKCACDNTGPCKAHGKKETDPLDEAMKDYLNRRLQIDIIKELDYDITDDLF